MKLSIPEEDIVLYETGFDETDFLNRKPFADKLSELIDKFETPFVVALDGPWGSGITKNLTKMTPSSFI